MKENKNIEKELLFKNNIKDITSISLDSDYKIVNGELVGNFLISGEYKTHEISLNREKFNFKIPFKQSFENDIDLDTVNIEITNFLYDYKKDELFVKIEYEVSGDRKDVLIFDDEESLEDFLNSREVEVVDTRLDEIKEEIIKDEEAQERNIEENAHKELYKEEVEAEEKLEIVEKKEENKEHEIIDVEDRISKLEEKNEDMVTGDEIISNVGNIEDGFVTYKVYKIKENETLESIVIKYKTSIDELKEYNDLNNLSVNDKIIIPQYE